MSATTMAAMNPWRSGRDGRKQRTNQILLIRHDKDMCPPELVITSKTMQFFFGFGDPFPVI